MFARLRAARPWSPTLALLTALACRGQAPVHPEAVRLNAEGARALATGELEIADARLALALEYHGRFVEAVTNLGLVELSRGNLDRAEKLLRRAHRLNRDLAQPLHGLGTLCELRGDDDEAERRFRQALRVDPGFAPARLALGRLLLRTERPEAARVELRRLDQLPARDAESAAALVEALDLLGRDDDAAARLGAARLQWPTDPSLAVLAARRALGAGEAATARRILEALPKRADPLGGRIRAWLAVACWELGDDGCAERAAAEALGLVRDEPVALVVAARLRAAAP